MSEKLKRIPLGTEMMTSEEVSARLEQKQDVLSGSRLSAVNSGITQAKVASFTSHVSNSELHTTQSEKSRWNAAQPNEIERILVNGVEVAITNKAVNISVPETGNLATKAELETKVDKATYLSDKANFATKTDLEEKQDSLTDAQIAAVDSGVTSSKVVGYDGHVANGGIHVTSSDKAKWNSAQANVIEVVKVNGTAVPVSGKAVNIAVPTLETIATKEELATKVDKTVFNTAIANKQDNLSQQQLAAVNSGATASKISDSVSHIGDSSIHVTQSDKTKWNGHVASITAHTTSEEKAKWNAGIVTAEEKNKISTAVQVVKVNGTAVSKSGGEVDIPVPSVEGFCTKNELDDAVAELEDRISAKQDALSEAQIAAANSGITASELSSMKSRMDALEEQLGDIPEILSEVLGE